MGGMCLGTSVNNMNFNWVEALAKGPVALR